MKRSRGVQMLAALSMALVVCWARGALASGDGQTPSNALSLSEVLQSVDRMHPLASVATQQRIAAQGQERASRGNWDPKLSAEGIATPVGFYDTSYFAAQVRQSTPLWGLDMYAGYRRGQGNFPVYKLNQETLSNGEVRAGLELPVLKDGAIDPERAEIKRRSHLTEGARCREQSTRLRLHQSAAKAYYAWVGAGRLVRIQRQLLAVARDRNQALVEQESLGSVPTIVVIDNERLILDRKSKLVLAEQEFSQAALQLSLFLRNERGESLTPDEARLPAGLPPVRDAIGSSLSSDTAAALRVRPELCELGRLQKGAEVNVRLAKNQRAPDLRARAFVARDWGEGPAELEPVEVGVGVTIEMPLGLTQARGEYAARRAERAALAAELRYLEDRVRTSVAEARLLLKAAREQLELANKQLRVAGELAEAERYKFETGASDLVVVNLRELAFAEAERQKVEAIVSYHQAYADYLAALGRSSLTTRLWLD